MITFLYPFLLGLGILIAVPFIIHLFGERTYHPVAFSSLKFLREIEKESLKRLQLRQWLILLSRALWIGMLVLALALPYANVSGGKIKTGILVIDKSFSTRIDPLFIELEKNIQKEYERWTLVAYDEKTQIDSIKKNIQMLIDENRMKEPAILLLSDFQNNKQNKSMMSMLESFSNRMYLLPKVKMSYNAALKDLSIINTEDRNMNGIRAYLSINEPESSPATIYIGVNGKPKGQTQVNKSGSASFYFEKPNEKESICTASCSNDTYGKDNKRYLVLNNFNKIKILCVNDPKDQYYHLNALRALSDIDLTEVAPGELASHDFEEYDMVWFSGIYQVNKPLLERLERYTDKGVLLVTASKTIRENDLWHDLIGNIQQTKPQEGYLGVINSKEQDMADMKIRHTFRSGLKPISVIWETSDGSPLLFKKSRNLFLLLSPFHFSQNEMGLSPYFTRELTRGLDDMLERTADSYFINDPIPLGGSISLVTTPMGEEYRVKDIFDKTSVPGFYTIENEREKKTVAVNILPDECIQSEIERKDLQTIEWNGKDIKEIHRQIKGRDIQTLFYILAALFIILEMLLLRKGERTD